jgi:phosphoglycolate phosphatase
MSKPADLVFDLDGTISDPLVGIYRSINHALTSHGFEEVPRSAVAQLVGPPLDDVFRTLLADRAEPRIPSLVTKFRERYAQLGYAENTIYEGVVDALHHLSSRRLRLGVCTSKRVDFAEKILDLFGIRGLFAFIDGGDVGVEKARQLKALRKLGMVGKDSMMIGDRSVDISAARVNGLRSVGVLWGYGSETELREAGAEAILEHTSELSRL